MRALSIAASGMQAQQLNVEVISNNIANMNTTGFKRQRAEFQDLIYQNIERVGSVTSQQETKAVGIQIGTGVRTSGTYRLTTQGNVIQTGNTYDVAIQGKGYLRVLTPSGEEAYTRAGALQLDDTGQIVTAEGYPIVPSILIPSNSVAVTINGSGTVSIKLEGQSDLQTVGQITTANFANEAGLEAIGKNLLIVSPSSGPAIVGTPGDEDFGSLLQGAVETSNVNPVEEISQLITAQRAYEMNSRVIQTADAMMQTLSQAR